LIFNILSEYLFWRHHFTYYFFLFYTQLNHWKKKYFISIHFFINFFNPFSLL
jgi:hypothetical protein